MIFIVHAVVLGLVDGTFSSPGRSMHWEFGEVTCSLCVTKEDNLSPCLLSMLGTNKWTACI